MVFGPQTSGEAEIFALEELRADIQYEITKVMNEGGVSRSDLAKRLKCSPARISQLLDDDANLTLETISKVLLALGRRWVIGSEDSLFGACVEDQEEVIEHLRLEDWAGYFSPRVSVAARNTSICHSMEALFRDARFHETVDDFELVTNDNYSEDEASAA